MTKPSNNWTSTLIKLIMECESETGYKSFQYFIDDLMPSEGTKGNVYIIKALKELEML